MGIWKFTIYAIIFYLVVSLITKICDKRKVKKYGKDIVINDKRNNNGNNTTDNVGSGSTKPDKQ